MRWAREGLGVVQCKHLGRPGSMCTATLAKLGRAVRCSLFLPAVRKMMMPHPGPLIPAATGTQAYVRKLEARLLSVRGAVELQEHCRKLKGQLDVQVGGGVWVGVCANVPACPHALIVCVVVTERGGVGVGGPKKDGRNDCTGPPWLPSCPPSGRRRCPLPQAHALHEAEARASEAEDAARVAGLDAACLKRGLELAAEQLTRSAGAEVPGTLLKAVARVRGLAGA